MKPIRNIFKMSRILVDPKNKAKERSKSKSDKDFLNATDAVDEDGDDANSIDFAESESSQDSD